MGLAKLFSSSRHFRNLFKCNRVFLRLCSGKPCGGGSGEEPSMPTDDGKKGAVIGVYEGSDKFELTPAAEKINSESGGKVCQHLNEIACRLKLGKAFVFTNLVPEYTAVAISCYGPKDAAFNKLEELNEARENVRVGVGAGVFALRKRGCGHIAVDGAEHAGAAAEAARLAAWRFEEFKHKTERQQHVHVVRLNPNSEKPADSETMGWDEGIINGRAQNWARYLSDMPANMMAPVDFAQHTLNKLCPLGIKVDAHDISWIKAQKMQAFLAVAQGSCETPIFLECQYTGAPGKPIVLMAAKGVTFDSGGLCLKPGPRMVDNRGSMAGAAVTVAALKAFALLKVPINVNAVIPLCENMVSGQCMKVGDVVKALNGISIQIEDTDMEGRLMMADALVYGQSVYKPSLVVDVATFTHGILLATGGGAFGVFANNDELWRTVQHAGAQSGDRPWRLPLWNYYGKQITNETSVDLRNKGSGRASACIGAAFLRHFVCNDWIHMDITGVGKLGHSPAPSYLHPQRMTGRPTRTVIHTLKDIAASSNEVC